MISSTMNLLCLQLSVYYKLVVTQTMRDIEV